MPRPEHSPAWLAAGAGSIALIAAGVPVANWGSPAALYSGSILAFIGVIGLIVSIVGYRGHYLRMTECPLVLRHRSCCRHIENNEHRVWVEIFNPPHSETIHGVELRVEVTGAPEGIRSRTLKWVGEVDSKRDIKAGDWHHAEIAEIIATGQHYLVFWPLQGDEPDPRALAREPIAPGEYKAIITVTSERKPLIREVAISCPKDAVSLRCPAAPEPDP